MSRILISVLDGEVKKCIASISEMLTTRVNSSSTEVRKPTMLFFVAVMTQPKQKLINTFYSKRCPLNKMFAFSFFF
jgi:hypothetical protein